MEKDNRGIFITFEGCEGVGKSTQIGLLKEYLLSQKIDFIITREPGGTEISEKIRNIILDKENVKMAGMTEVLLYAASRSQHVAEVILPALRAGKAVICDRYSDSTLAYQAYARGIDLKTVRTINKLCAGGCEPDYTVFIDVSPEQGFLRKGGADKADRLENEKLDFHMRVYQGFQTLAKKYKKRIISITAEGTASETSQKIIDALKKRGVI